MPNGPVNGCGPSRAVSRCAVIELLAAGLLVEAKGLPDISGCDIDKTSALHGLPPKPVPNVPVPILSNIHPSLRFG